MSFASAEMIEEAKFISEIMLPLIDAASPIVIASPVTHTTYTVKGLSKREWYIGQALAGGRSVEEAFGMAVKIDEILNFEKQKTRQPTQPTGEEHV